MTERAAHRSASRDVLARYEPARIDDGVSRRPASVLLLLHDDGVEEHVLFQVRTSRVRYHKGEISLPGGGMDPDDESPLAAALRETVEEIGVRPEHIEVHGQLDQQVTRSGFHVTPFVGEITEVGPYPFTLANREVAELLAIPLAHLRSDEALRWVLRANPDEPPSGAEVFPEREFYFGEHRIWGLTARILGGYFDLLEGARRQPGTAS
jgi:8-oxo-dGTP pyrophosphatase MutT (NUDIX family)